MRTTPHVAIRHVTPEALDTDAAPFCIMRMLRLPNVRMLRFEEALARILALGAPALPPEVVLLEDAEGRVLAEDLVAPLDLPGFDYSSMDGYAVRTTDLDGPAPYRLPVRGES